MIMCCGLHARPLLTAIIKTPNDRVLFKNAHLDSHIKNQIKLNENGFKGSEKYTHGWILAISIPSKAPY